MSALLVASVGWLDAIGRGLREGFFMFWETLWPLVLGFGLSGAVQSFVSRASMQRKLGNHGVRATVRASGYGMVSSSCSYAASAMSKSLFVKGADFVSSLVFMFASTNLVLELGIILIVLMGWQFALSEFVGGAIMIVLLAALAGTWLHGRQIDDARQRLVAEQGTASEHHHGEVPESLAESSSIEAAPLLASTCNAGAHNNEMMSELQGRPWGVRLRSKAGWANAATYTMADLTMLRREMLIGYGIAGFLAALVPTRFWNIVFLHGHGFWTSLENVVVGPFIAIVSFVCSIGNVPLAAALWHGGISFGGVVSFIFADLIAFPLLLIYRRYYGTRLTLKMLATFWVVMAIAGLATEGLFTLGHLVPTTRARQVVPAHFSWNYTTYLNFIFLGVFALLFWVYRHRERFGAGAGYALDPVCGMQVETANAPASIVHEGVRIYFCSDHCRRRFDADPHRFLDTSKLQGGNDHFDETNQAIDPVCGMSVDPSNAEHSMVHNGTEYYFCCARCRERFAQEPEVFLTGGPVGMASSPQPVSLSMNRPRPSEGANDPRVSRAVDPVCDMTVEIEHAAALRRVDGTTFYFCSNGCAELFDLSHSV